jgi:PAS domain S-box-containing protein
MTATRGLPPSAVLEVFPFHLWLDEHLRLVQAGPVIHRLFPDLCEGDPVFAHFQILRPECPADAQALREHAKQHMVIEARATGLRLRGQILPIDDGSLVFLGSPWVTEVDELGRWGLSIADFAIHNPVADQLFLIRSIRATLDDTRKLAARVEDHRKRLLASQQRIDLHLRHTPLAVIDWDQAGRVAAWNPAAERIFAIAEAAAIGRDPSILRLIELPDEPRVGTTLKLVGATEESTVLLAHDIAGRSPTLCEWYNTPLVDASGQTIGVASIVRDVTDNLRTERALREAQKLESLGRLAGGLAHDFNNLLVALMGDADLALMKLRADTGAAAHIEQILVHAERAAELTRQLLDFSGHGAYRTQTVDLNEILRETSSLLAATIPRHVSVALRLGERIPPIDADISQLRQIAINLIINGAEAIGDAGGRIELRTRFEVLDAPLDDPLLRGGPLAPGPYVCFEVVDDGRGMAPDALAHVFDPFFSTKFVGRGLGLAPIVGIVKGHGAGVRVSSKLGAGTRFELWFPALAVPASAQAEQAEQATALGKRRVLIVDDEPAVRNMAVGVIEAMGYEVVAAAAGDAALALFDADPHGFDLVLTDLTMPGLDGHELFAELTDRDPRLPVILSSGYSHQRIAAYPDGRPATFLQKPYRARSLMETINAELERRAS